MLADVQTPPEENGEPAPPRPQAAITIIVRTLFFLSAWVKSVMYLEGSDLIPDFCVPAP